MDPPRPRNGRPRSHGPAFTQENTKLNADETNEDQLQYYSYLKSEGKKDEESKRKVGGWL